MKDILTKIFSEVFSSTWLYAVAAAAGLAAGVFFAGLFWQSQIDSLKASQAEAANLYQNELRQKEREYAQKLAAAADAKQSEIDRLQSALSSVRTDADRLRVAATRRSRVPASAGSACKSCQQQVAECIRLLSEGADLFEEGGGLLRDLNADREAIRKLK